MPSYVDQPGTKVRNDPLGPITINQAQQNTEVIDGLVLSEHFSDGQHNALEVPWVLGHINSGTTGSLFNTTYGGGTIARPATGRVTLNVASGVIGTIFDAEGALVPGAVVMANASDSAAASAPHVIEAELVSATSVELRTRYLTSTLGSPGNAWSTVAVGVDVAVHAQKQTPDDSNLVSRLSKRRRDFLTEQATDWNALVTNQGIVRKALALEHDAAGEHSVNRIAKAAGWFTPVAGPSFSKSFDKGVSAVSRVSTGVIEVTIAATLGSTNLAACFAQAQPSSENELVLINGYCTSTTKFRFYVYVYSVAENKWDRADRPFSAVMFGGV